MGTDIHLVAEVYDDGDWKPVPNPVRPCWLCIDHPGLYASWREQLPQTMVACPRCTADVNEATKYPPFHTPEAWFWERDYTLFSLLADVRNYYEPRITPLNFEYGIPDDLSWEHTNWMSQHDHLDTAGFGYCTDHGIWRRQYEPCRKLTPAELNRLARGRQIEKY